MSTPIIRTNIPTIPVSPIVGPDGYASNEEMQFRQNLIQTLQFSMSEEGLVAPSQNSSNIAIIAANKDSQGNFTCQGGTMIYNTDTNQLQVAILVGGIPTFKVVTVT